MHLYIHIPYCKRKCLYCDFLSVPVEGQEVSLYVKSLINDIKYEAALNKDLVLETVYIGGGTPGILPEVHITRIMEAVRECFILADDAEITIELNPCTVSADKLRAYKRAGINRISMGVQSFNDETLKTLGRVHTSAEAVSAFSLIRSAGFDNVNLDLISCVPGEDFKSFENSLGIMLRLDPEHISVYQLIVEEGTPFYSMFGPESTYAKAKDEDEEEKEAEIYLATSEILKKHGYEHYEISNFAKTGFISRHNSSYWRQEEYIGVGAGAVGFRKIKDGNGRDLSGLRVRKQTALNEYISGFLTDNAALKKLKELISEREELDPCELQKEYIMLGLRTMKGISEKEYREKFGAGLDKALKDVLAKYTPEYVAFENGRYHFTEKGFLVSNTILCELI